MLVLALDTATPTLVVGLARWSADGGADVLAERAVASGNRHAELLTPAIRDALADAGVVTYAHTTWGNWTTVEHEVRLSRGWNTVTLTRATFFAEVDAVDVS